MYKPTASHTGWKFGQIFLDSAIRDNIVLAQAIGICPIILAGTDLKSGVVLTVCTLLVLLPVSFLMSLIGNRLPNWLHPVIYTLSASILLTGAAFVLDNFISTTLYAQLHLFIPLMAVNTIFTYRVGGFSIGNRPAAAIADALGSSFGFGLVICLVGLLRELLRANTIWGVPVPIELTLTEAAEPFLAFILLGFMAAALQVHAHRKKDDADPAFIVSDEEVDARD
ncbi:MAG: hypothetical protein IJC17_07750 [Clostridia bacterium]|nr:hypothetical protein [Clostridia bacterium]